MPPCTMPNSACGFCRRSNSARLRAAQRNDSSIERARFLLGRRIRRALVEDHRDVRIEVALHLHRALGRQHHRIAVDRRAEAHALLRDLAQRRQAEDLKAARVGQDRPFPVHEADAGRRAHASTSMPGRSIRWNVLPRMICAPMPVELLGRHRLDGAVRADRHERRRLDDAARQTSCVRGARRPSVLEKIELHERARSTLASAAGLPGTSHRRS